MGQLYIVPTPIGNLEDISLRALRTLREAALIAAEDTRTSRVLTRHYDIDTPMISYHEHNKLSRIEDILGALERGDVALISDAGTPGISDPGYELIAAAIDAGFNVAPLPGASAITAALTGSGLATDRFLFVGFLPRKSAALRGSLAELTTRRETVVAFESPYRLRETLALLAEVAGDRRVCVAREISKKFEEFLRGTAVELSEYFEKENPRGEVTLVIAGADASDAVWTESQVKRALAARLASGASLSRAASDIARSAGWKKKAVYQLGVQRK